LKALTDVLLRHPHVWIMLDGMTCMNTLFTTISNSAPLRRSNPHFMTVR